MKKIYFYILISSIIGCSTLSDKQCKEGDWQRIGYVDGAKGRPATYLQHHMAACTDTTVEVSPYQVGRKQGLQNYCTPVGGYRAGEQGQPYFGVCSKESEVQFKEQYQKGHKVYLLRKRKAEVVEKINKEREAIDKDQSVVNHVAQAINLISGTSATETLDKEESELNKQIYSIESEKPIGVSSYNSIKPWDGLVNAMGAALGSIGFKGLAKC